MQGRSCEEDSEDLRPTRRRHSPRVNGWSCQARRPIDGQRLIWAWDHEKDMSMPQGALAQTTVWPRHRADPSRSLIPEASGSPRPRSLSGSWSKRCGGPGSAAVVGHGEQDRPGGTCHDDENPSGRRVLDRIGHQFRGDQRGPLPYVLAPDAPRPQYRRRGVAHLGYMAEIDSPGRSTRTKGQGMDGIRARLGLPGPAASPRWRAFGPRGLNFDEPVMAQVPSCQRRQSILLRLVIT